MKRLAILALAILSGCAAPDLGKWHPSDFIEISGGFSFGSAQGTAAGGPLTTGDLAEVTGIGATTTTAISATGANTFGANGVTTTFTGTTNASLVDGTMTLGSVNFSGALDGGDNDRIALGAQLEARFSWSTIQATANNLLLGIDADGLASGGGAFVITHLDNRAKDHDHPVSLDPSLIIHSLTDPDSANDEFLRMFHNVTQPIFQTGSGAFRFSTDGSAADGTVELATLDTGSADHTDGGVFLSSTNGYRLATGASLVNSTGEFTVLIDADNDESDSKFLVAKDSHEVGGSEVDLFSVEEDGTVTVPLGNLVVTSDGLVSACAVQIGGEADDGFYTLDTNRVAMAINGVLKWDYQTGLTRTFDDLFLNGNALSSLSRVVEANTAVAAAPNALTAALDGWNVLTNEGVGAQNVHDLDSAAAGITHTFIVQDANGIKINANTGDTLSLNNAVSSSAGYCESTEVGAVLTLTAINATEWIATHVTGQWSVYDGSASNPATQLYAEMYLSSAAETTLTSTTPAKAAGTTTAGDLRGFTHAANRLTYDGIATKVFRITASIGVSKAAGSTELCTVHIYKDGATVNAQVDRTVSSSDEGAVAVTALVSLATDEYIEVWLNSAGDNLTWESGTVTISAVSVN